MAQPAAKHLMELIQKELNQALKGYIGDPLTPETAERLTEEAMEVLIASVVYRPVNHIEVVFTIDRAGVRPDLDDDCPPPVIVEGG